MAALLEFDGLVRRFGRLAVLRGVSGRVEEGQVLLVTGSNGAGKSTLLRCLAGLLRPQAGSIRCEEEGRGLTVAERRRRIGWVAPDLAFYEPLSVGENLELFARLRRVDAGPALASMVSLGVPLDRAAGALSSGMRQRLRWVWALLHRPGVLLLDEPFQNLDAAGETAVRQLLGDHLRRGLAVVATPTALDLPRVAARLELTP